jgi:hypothetical protein
VDLGKVFAENFCNKKLFEKIWTVRKGGRERRNNTGFWLEITNANLRWIQTEFKELQEAIR